MTVPLVQRLPTARGRLRSDAVLAKTSWFRVGGPAEVLFSPADLDDLTGFLAALDPDIPVTVVGRASNVLIRDGGVPGVVIRLGRAFAGARVHGAVVEAGAATASADVARAAQAAGIAGFGFLEGIPGSVGGALRMNAGCHGKEVRHIVVAARAVDRAGCVHDLRATDLGLDYRQCTVPADWIFVSAQFAGAAGDPAVIAACMRQFRDQRERTQPSRVATGGSTFRNPPDQKAWVLIERAGCRGLRRNGASVSEKHANFLVNDGSASAADLEALGEDVRHRVRTETGILLEWEIHRIGRPLGGPLP